MWLKKAAKDFCIGDIIKHTSTGQTGIIVNFYLGRYIIEFTTDKDNAFKRTTLSLPKDAVIKDYTKVSGLVKSAAENVTDFDKTQLAGALEDIGKPDSTSAEKAAAAAKLGETALKARDYITQVGVATYGSTFTELLSLGVLVATDDLGKIKTSLSPEEQEALLETDMNLAAEIEAPLRTIFEKYPYIQKNIIKMLGSAHKDQQSAAPEDYTLIPLVSLAQLLTYVINIYLATTGNATISGDSSHTTYTPRSTNPLHVQEQIFDTAYKEKSDVKLKEQLPQLKQDVEDYFAKHPNQSETQRESSVKNNMLKQSYDISVNDRIHSAQYGAGVVTDVGNLEFGYVGVAFGDHVRIAAYPADKISKPYTERTCDGFTCPMDKSVISATACLGDIPGSSCSFLRFIENKPSCTYAQEMNAVAAKQENIKIAAAQQHKEHVCNVSLAKASLNKVLADAQFEDHDYFQINEYTPVRVANIVRIKNSNIYATVLYRNADTSLTLELPDGGQMPAWETEVEGVEPAVIERLKLAKKL